MANQRDWFLQKGRQQLGRLSQRLWSFQPVHKFRRRGRHWSQSACPTTHTRPADFSTSRTLWKQLARTFGGAPDRHDSNSRPSTAKLKLFQLISELFPILAAAAATVDQQSSGVTGRGDGAVRDAAAGDDASGSGSVQSAAAVCSFFWLRKSFLSEVSDSRV